MTGGRIAIYRKGSPHWTGALIIGEYDIEGIQYSFRTRAEGGGLWVNWLAASGAEGNVQRWHEQYCGNLPGNLRIVEAYGTIVIGKFPYRPYCFVKASDGQLWVCFFEDRWHWSPLGLPPGDVSMIAPMGALTARGWTFYCFVLGSDEKVWVNWWAGEGMKKKSLWSPLGRPDGVTLSRFDVLADNQGSRPLLFAIGSDGALWVGHSELPEKWRPLGKPQTADLSAPMGAIVTDQKLEEETLSIFALGDDDRLYTSSGTGDLSASWSPLPPPPGPLGTLLAARMKGGRPYIFINRGTPLGSGAREPDIYCWAGSEWQAITYPEDMIEARVGWNRSGELVLLAVAAERVWTAYERPGRWEWSSLPLEGSLPAARSA